MEVEIKEMPEFRLASLRHHGPYRRISEAFARLGNLAAQAALFGSETLMIAIYHDDPDATPEAELRSDAALAISAGAQVPDSLVEQRLPGGRYACAVHRGSYERLGDSWAALIGEWLPRSGNEPGSGPSYEIYLNTPADVAIDELRTELYVHLANE